MADKTDDLIISISTDLATVKRSLNRLVGDIGQASGQITKQFDSVGKSIDKSMTTALQSRINGMVGIGQQAVREWNGALADQGKELERLRAKYNPLFATINSYKTAVVDIKRAQALGAISSEEYAAAMSKERQAALASIAAIKGRNAAIADTPVQRAVNGNVGAFQTSNIAAQFQDIAVTSAMGMSPLQIALQQGTQLSSVFNDLKRDGQGIGTALASAFGSLISPVSLVTIGLIAGGAALIQYASSATGSTKTADDAIKSHAETIASIKDAYGVASEGLGDYVKKSQAEAAAAARENLKVQQEVAKEAVSDFNKTLGVLAARTGGASDIAGRFKPFTDAIHDFRKSIAEGSPDFAKFRTDVEAIVATNPEGLRKLADEIINGSSAAADAERRVKAAKDIISGLGNVADDQTAGVNALRDALKELSEIAMPALTDSQKAADAFKRAMEAARGSEDRRAAAAQYDATLKRIDDQNPTINGVAVPTPSSRPLIELEGLPGSRSSRRSKPKTADDRFAEDIQAIRDRSTALQQEIGLIGLSYEEQTKRRAALDLEQKALADLREEARKKGQTDLDSIKLSPEKIAAIEQESAAYAAQAEALRQAQEANQLMSDVTRGFVHDLLNGTSAAESFANALSKIADKLIDDVLDSILQVNGASSGGGGLLGALFGSLLGGGGQLGIAKAGGIGMYAKGTDFAPGGLAVVGEQGPELVNLPRGSQVVPNHRIPSLIDRSASGSSPSITYAPVIDARGADSAAVARLEQIMAKERAEFSAKVIDTVKNGQRRRLL